MPLYQYAHDGNAGTCQDPFEVLARHDEVVTSCPRCGCPVRKVPAAFTAVKNVLSTSNIKEKGFQRLRRRDKGVYEKD
ncbi:MAG: zinc ribbon domain-containing protein [Pseudomonadota bacterium]